MNRTTQLISSLLVSLAIFGGLLLIRSTLTDTHAVTNNSGNVYTKTILTIDELSEYLGVSVQDIEGIISRDKADIQGISGKGVYDTYRFLPYFELQNGKKVFYLTDVEKWVSFNSLNRP